MKTITVNRRNILIASAVGLMLIALGTGLSSPETKTETRTRTVTEQVKGDTKYELSPICRKALVGSVQTVLDLQNLIVSIGRAGSELSASKMSEALDEQTEVNDRMLENTKVVMACDPTVGQDIDFGNL